MAFGWNGSICFLIAFQMHAYPLLNLTLFILNLEFAFPHSLERVKRLIDKQPL